MALFDKTIDTLSTSLDMMLIKHSVITDNIANAETPGFKARRVEFETALQKAVEATETGGETNYIHEVKPTFVEDPRSELGQDLNSVDMDREMSDLTKNDIKYSAATQVINKKFSLLRYAISEGDR